MKVLITGIFKEVQELKTKKGDSFYKLVLKSTFETDTEEIENKLAFNFVYDIAESDLDAFCEYMEDDEIVFEAFMNIRPYFTTRNPERQMKEKWAYDIVAVRPHKGPGKIMNGDNGNRKIKKKN